MAIARSFVGAEWVWLLFGQALPEATQRSAFGGRCSGEERLPQNVVMSVPGGLQHAITIISEDGEPSSSVSGVDLSTDQAVTFETRHEMRRTSWAEQHAIGEI